MMLAISVCSLFVVLGIAQDLSVPSTWREPSTSRSLSERITISQAATNSILPQLTSNNGQFNGIGYWQSANVWSALAIQDEVIGSTTNEAAVTNGLNTAFSLYSDYDQFGVGHFISPMTAYLISIFTIKQFGLILVLRWWATAAVYAYRAYGDTNLLAHAVAVWNHVTTYVVTPAAASSGTLATKSFTVSGTCDGVTMAGGVFWRSTTDDQGINSITTGLYVTLSAYLGEIYGDSKYTNAAIASANWIKNLNINSGDIVLDTVNGHDCTRSPSSWLFTYNSGKYIEGLSVLGAVTGDAQWTNLMLDIVAAAVKSSAWEGTDGIITEGASPSSNNDDVGFKAIFIRGLHETFTRSASNTNLQGLIRSYIDVQYNALLELADNGSTYSSAWNGPPQSFTTWGQLAALDVLVSAIDTNN
ncbi:hypothetical protein EW026_g6407 [Hermanssonia centrifuga]|uniref:Endo-1,6-alpha-mannosidase n=1 Tax=Hermanssonia centrifuga TaxID=98765 RepID=A0A4S4KCX0_9APHY|nr:hypothetical protein EW026_g6407 [Hermanssonia centrifuga]